MCECMCVHVCCIQICLYFNVQPIPCNPPKSALFLLKEINNFCALIRFSTSLQRKKKSQTNTRQIYLIRAENINQFFSWTLYDTYRYQVLIKGGGKRCLMSYGTKSQSVEIWLFGCCQKLLKFSLLSNLYFLLSCKDNAAKRHHAPSPTEDKGWLVKYDIGQTLIF